VRYITFSLGGPTAGDHPAVLSLHASTGWVGPPCSYHSYHSMCRQTGPAHRVMVAGERRHCKLLGVESPAAASLDVGDALPLPAMPARETGGFNGPPSPQPPPPFLAGCDRVSGDCIWRSVSAVGSPPETLSLFPKANRSSVGLDLDLPPYTRRRRRDGRLSLLRSKHPPRTVALNGAEQSDPVLDHLL